MNKEVAPIERTEDVMKTIWKTLYRKS